MKHSFRQGFKPALMASKFGTQESTDAVRAVLKTYEDIHPQAERDYRLYVEVSYVDGAEVALIRIAASNMLNLDTLEEKLFAIAELRGVKWLID